jgi:hypothetical protein
MDAAEECTNSGSLQVEPAPDTIGMRFDEHTSRTESQDELSLHEARVAVAASRASPPGSSLPDAGDQLFPENHARRSFH